MSQQPSFLSQFARDVMLPSDSHVVQPAEVKRLAGQNVRVLARLEQGPATRAELAALATNVTARISDVRFYLQATRRQTVKLIHEDFVTGLTRYAIRPLEESQ